MTTRGIYSLWMPPLAERERRLCLFRFGGRALITSASWVQFRAPLNGSNQTSHTTPTWLTRKLEDKLFLCSFVTYTPSHILQLTNLIRNSRGPKQMQQINKPQSLVDLESTTEICRVKWQVQVLILISKVNCNRRRLLICSSNCGIRFSVI